MKEKKITKSQIKKKKLNNLNIIRINNPEKKYVTGIKSLRWKHNKEKKKSVELSEKSLHYALSAFLKDDCEIIKNRKALKDSKYTIYPDYVVKLRDPNKSFKAWEKNKEVPIKGIIFEYDGDKHYYSMMKIESDNIKKLEIMRLKYRRIRIPFYYQLTIDIAKFIFDDLMFHFSGKKYFSLERYYEAIKEIYKDPITGESLKKLSAEDLKNKDYPVVYSPGMAGSEYVPATFHDHGLKRFLKDFEWRSPRPGAENNGYLESAKHQIFRALQLYIEDTKNSENEDNKSLILPVPSKSDQESGHQKSYYANKFMKEYEKFEKQPKQECFKEVFYLREEYRDLLEKYNFAF